MESLVTELRTAREQKGISLQDIADSTLINIRFLEAIDAGNLAFLPQTYVRAFLREYATAVGIDPEEAMRAYDAESSPQASQNPVAPVTAADPPPSSPPPAPDRKEDAQISPTMALIAFVVIGVLALTVVLWNILAPETSPVVREIPFEDVRRQQDGDGTAASDTAALSTAAPAARSDTLILTAVASDSVWMQVTVDDASPRDAYLRKDQRRTWKAAGRLLLTLGNAGAVEFTLNGKRLGALGKSGAVLREHAITHATLTQTERKP